MTSPSSTLPIRLFLDKKSLDLVGDSAMLRWWVLNQGSRPIRNLKVDLHSRVVQPDLVIAAATARDRVALQGGEMLGANTALTIKSSGHYTLEVCVEGQLDDCRIEAVSTQEPVFKFVKPEAGVETHITVEGSALIKNVSSTGSLNIKVAGDALLKGLHIGSGNPDDQSMIGHAAPAIEDLIEISLRIPEAKYLYPLELEKLVAAWPWSQHLVLDFVDEHGRQITEARVDQVYRLRLKTFGAGYPLLVSRGSSGKYYLMGPDRRGIGVARLPQGEYLYPGPELFPVANLPEGEHELYFADPGVESMLAVLTLQPLLSDPLEGLSPFPAEHVASLLADARARPGTDIGLAKITVKPA
jgi:hypothetical protein